MTAAPIQALTHVARLPRESGEAAARERCSVGRCKSHHRRVDNGAGRAVAHTVRRAR
jgi:hypothetical protein